MGRIFRPCKRLLRIRWGVGVVDAVYLTLWSLVFMVDAVFPPVGSRGLVGDKRKVVGRVSRGRVSRAFLCNSRPRVRVTLWFLSVG